MTEQSVPQTPSKSKASFYIMSFLALPLALGLVALAIFTAEFVIPNYLFTIIVTIAGILLVVFGFTIGRKLPAPKSFFARQFALFLPLFLLMVAYGIGKLVSGYSVMADLGEVVLTGAVVIVTAPLWLGFTVGTTLRERPQKVIFGLLALVALFAVFGGGLYGVHSFNRQNIVRGYAKESAGHDVIVWEYLPFRESPNNVYKADFPISLEISSNHPRLDGAIAVLPVYAAFAQATYKGLDQEKADSLISCTNTPSAFKALLEGEIDIFFGVPPSKKQLQSAADKGVELVITPMAKEAFVFFVNADNPVNGLTSTQIQNIYSKTVTDWEDVGGTAGRISPFQRPEGSGSQSAMQNMVMKDRRLARPILEERYEGMGGIIRGVASYRNGINAIGYSFRWYATTLIRNPKIKLIAVDGAMPTVENISANAYPYITNLVMITRKEAVTPEMRRLMDWILGPEGQRIARDVGYVPMNN